MDWEGTLRIDTSWNTCHNLDCMTVQQIHKKLSRHKKVSRNQLYTYFKACQIEPIGARQKPQRYPEDAADKIITYLGFKIVSMRTLKAERKKAGRNGHRRAA